MMAEESNTKIQANLQSFLTEHDHTEKDNSRRDLNTDLPTGQSVRFMQFCRLMQSGFQLKAWGEIGDQAGAIMVSNKRQGRTEAVDALTGMDKKERERYRMGPSWDDKSEDKGGRK
ncbi:hypothetical protein DSECCO2_509620 [anaerobic digester metagenome]|jgi:hypothetical protein